MIFDEVKTAEFSDFEEFVMTVADRLETEFPAVRIQGTRKHVEIFKADCHWYVRIIPQYVFIASNEPIDYRDDEDGALERATMEFHQEVGVG